MYKDKDKQRQADRARQQRRRDVIKSKGVTNQGVTVSGSGAYVTPTKEQGMTVIDERPDEPSNVKPFTDMPNTETIPPVEQVRYKLPDVVVKPYQMTVMERLFYRPASKLGRGETNFVSLPGRACYGVV